MINQTKLYMGIDVSKDSLDSYLSGHTIKYSNNRKGIEKMLNLIDKNKVDHIVFESTGGYERLISEALEKEERTYSMLNPFNVKSFGRAKSIIAKTDPIDAKLLAEYGQCMNPKPTLLKSKEIQHLGSLVSRRQQLVKMQSAEKNHYKSPLQNKVSDNSVSKILLLLKDEIALIEGRIKEVIEENNEFKRKYNLLTSFKGVGLICAANILAFLPETGNLSREDIAALVGVAPYNNQSGKSEKPRSITGGRKEIRDVLYMATITAIRSNLMIKNHYAKLKSRGKAHKVCAVACMRKTIITLNAMIRDEKSWDSVRFATQKQEYVKQVKDI